jgi:uncharacterized damage-inducible protein DinB
MQNGANFAPDMELSLKHFLAYNAWANTRIAENIPSEAADVELISSFTTIRKTVFHMWDAQQIWLTRLKGERITDWPSKAFSGSFSEALELFVASSQQLAAFASAQDDAFFPSLLTYTNTQGKAFVNSHEEILMHVCNHTTYHRGQLVTMLRNAGVTTIPSTDMITYFRELRK